MLAAIKNYFEFAGPKRRPTIIRALCADFIKNIMEGLQGIGILYVIKAIINKDVTWKTGLIASLIIILLIIGIIFFNYYANINKYGASYKMVSDSMIANGERMKYIPLGFFNENSLGEITQAMTNSMSDIEDQSGNVLLTVVEGFIQIFTYMLIIAFIDYRITLLMIFTFLIFIINQLMQQKGAKSVTRKREKGYTAINSATLEFIQGMGVVREYNLSEKSNQRITNAIRNCEDMNIKLEFALMPFFIISRIILDGGSVLICLLALYLYSKEELSIISCIMILFFSFNVYRKLRSAGQLSSLIELIQSAFDRVKHLSSAPLMDIDGHPITLDDFEIVGEHIKFKYDKRMILDDVSFNIKKGSTTAIVGPSGSGKTTLCNLIARFWDVDEGSIKIGGHDVRELKLDSLLSNISMVFQNVYLFNDTIANNIKFGKPDATMDDVIDAGVKACCDDFIERFPDGYNTIIGEGGSTLSGGEKQRISIARAILKDAPIIILDESTANIDPENEDKIQHAFQSLFEGKTKIIIAHRIKTIKHADQILVMNKGKIVEKGTHESLMEKGGLYSKFVNIRKESINWEISN